MRFSRQTRRRVVVQLAALVDLLFVVFFLQYAQMQKSSAEDRAKGTNAQKTTRLAIENQDKLVQERNELYEKNRELQRRLAESEAKTMDTQKRAQDQIDLIAKTAQEMLRGVDPKAVAEQMRGATNEQRDEIVEELRSAQKKSPAGLVQSLRKSAELQKRCDVWEVHLSADGRARIRGPGIQDRFIVPKDENDFCNQFMQVVGETREPLSLVLILFTHGNVEARDLHAVNVGLEQVRKTWSARVPASKSIQVATPGYSEEPP
jgi:hypothetical protein